MRIAITYDLKEEALVDPDLPDDLQEEFDSPATIEAIATVLRSLGHKVVLLGDGPEMLQRLLKDPPDFVFNFAEGHGIARSREARVPAVLELLDIPYTGSDPLTMAVTLDKDCAKRIVHPPVPAPRGYLVHSEDEVEQPCTLPFPVIVKPAWEGSSKGIRKKCLVESASELPAVLTDLLHDYRQPVLVEEFIQGDEITVGVIGNGTPRVIGVMRVLPLQRTNRFVYSLEVKRNYLEQVRYECPAALPPEVDAAIRRAALDVYRLLSCRDVARVDFRVRDGIPYFLEVNPLPGLNPVTSDLVILARLAGWSYERLIESILKAALERHPAAGLPLRARSPEREVAGSANAR